MAVAKVTLNNNVIVDMTDATATAAEILQNETAYIADGSKATGTASGGGVTKSITNILGDSTTLVTGYLNSGGTSITSASAQKEVTTDYIDIHAYAGDAIIMWQKIGGRVGAWVTAVYYDSNKTRLTTRQGICEPLASNSSFRATSSVEYDATTGVSLASSTAYTIPSNAYYARFSFRTGGNAKICATTDMTSLGYWSHDISEIAFIDAIESDGTAT